MQQNYPSPNQNINPTNQEPQTPQVNPTNQTYINTTPPPVNPTQNTTTPGKSDTIEKVIQIIWFVVGFINVILILRTVFLLFDAKSSGFRGFLYNVTSPFVMPFIGIFPTRGEATAYFDTASLVAIIIYSLAAWGVVTLIRIVSSKQPVS